MQATNNPNSLKRVAMATMIGTAIEYFDNYIYAMAAVIDFQSSIFPRFRSSFRTNCCAFYASADFYCSSSGGNIIRTFLAIA